MNVAALDRFLTEPPFAGLDAEFGRLMERLAGGSQPELRLAAALVSRRRSEGQVCLDLIATASSEIENAAGERMVTPALSEWRERLHNATLVVGGPGESKPLILDGPRLYWRRYWDYEQRLAATLRERAVPMEAVETRPNPARLREGLERLLPRQRDGSPDWQQVAAFLVVRQRLTVILGGPGTGKTRTVARALALLLELHGPAWRMAVTAPTGKASARLQATLRRAKRELENIAPNIAALADEVPTIHRLLKINPETGCPRFDASNPLPLDVLVVDEASMVDLALMAKLVTALPARARLVLLGDRDQLAAVEAGSVLGDLASGAGRNRFSPALAAEFAATTGDALPEGPGASLPLADCFVELRENHRFGRGSGIYRASQAVNAGDATAALAVMERRKTKGQAVLDGQAAWQELPGRAGLKAALRTVVLAGFESACRAADPAAGLLAMERFRLLAAVRSGPFGVENLNQIAEDLLREAGLIDGGVWYAGRQVLVTTNDPGARLFNGDLGLVLPDSEGRMAVWFGDGEGQSRRVAPARLPPHQTAFALTVHKSQGSEFDEVLLILPERPSPVVTRELVYTGLTRARRRTEIWSSEAVFRDAVARRTERASGLTDRLWGRPMVGPTGLEPVTKGL